ncbi:MAG: hypothetical protein K0S68_151, partial [Candidatus Saccharibacteria bacterium]|nr:hypothetical protein [Candidatus Saccharibacteria bacterium]
WEEVNVITRGANLGWPCWESTEQQNGTGVAGIGKYKDLPFCQNLYQNPPANLKFPIVSYPHPPSSAVIGGVFYNGNNYPAAYKGRYFYGDYAKDQIYNLQLDAANNLVPNSNQTFASNAGGPVNFFTGPDGDIYYLAINKGSIYHLTYTAGNQAPNAQMAADKTFGPAPLAVNFTSSGSSDPEGDALAYRWDFGDGSPAATVANPAHTFAQNGTYTVTLTVTDIYNNASSKTMDIHVGQTAPTVTINTPAESTVANPEQIISYSGSATDVQDGTLPASALKWNIALHHCPLDSCHVHNVLDTVGAGGQFEFPHHDGPWYIQITLSATNSVGLTSTKSVTVYPAGQAITHALQFDGVNDYAIAAAPADFRLQQFTAEAMIKGLTTDDWGSEIVSMGNNWIVRLKGDGNLQFSFASGPAWNVLETTDVNAKDGLWHHVAATRTASAMKLYVDGVLKAQVANANAITYNYGGNFIVGRHGDGDDHFNFNGGIDEIRVWSIPRTDAEIAQYDSTTLPAGQGSLVGYWKADAGNGLTAADTGATGAHNLTLVNGTGWTAGAPLSDPTTPPPPPPAPTTKPITQIADTFTGTAVDAVKWAAYGPAGSVAQNGTLQITPPTNATGYYGVVSKEKYELKSNAIFLEVPQTTSATTPAAETQLILEADANNSIVMGFTGGSLHLRHKVAGANSDTFVPYSATAMRWWRIAEAAGSITLQTSPDGTTWTTRRTLTKAFDLSQLKVVLQSGAYAPSAAPGAARFDNLNTAATTPPPATTNSALRFNGTATGSAAVATTAYNTQAFTAETWVKAEATGIYGGEILSNGNNYGVRLLPDGNLRFYVHTGNYVWKNYETTGVNLKDNVWHHVAVTKSATTAQIYIDGVLKQTFSAPEAVAYTIGNNLVIGRHGDGDNNFNLTGTVDEFRIWNTVRTAAQIQASRSVELTAPVTGLVGYWQFNAGTGTTIADASGNNRPFTAAAGTSWVTGFPRQ